MAFSRPEASGSTSLASAGIAILGGAQVSLTLLEKAVDGTNIPFVKGVAGAALEVIKIVKAIQTNREECTNLVERCTSLLVVILGSLTGKTEDAIPDHLRRGVERLTVNFQEVRAELRIIDTRTKKWRAVLYHLDNGDRLKGCSEKLQWAMEEFQVTVKVDSCLKDLERHEELRRGQEKIQESQITLQMGQVAIQEGQVTLQESQQELLKGQANIEESVMKGQKEVRDGLSVIQEAMKDQSTGHASSSLPSTVLPPDPQIFGRQEYIEKAVKLLGSTTGAKIAILGPGGMGKTSVALKVIHDALVVELFGDNRCWIPCEQATSVPLFIELVAKSLNLPSSSSNDRLADIIAFLKSSKLLYILLFDNFETPWDIEGQQSNVADVLTAIASIPTVSFIITMRGNQHPSSHTVNWTEPRLRSLTQLDLDAAEEAFLRISPDARGDPELRTLLQKLDCMPLAITLMAKLSEAGETVSDLLEQWKSERTRLLDQPGGDRRNSIEVSIKLSLDSRSVKGNPDAIRLLSVLAMLPAGASLVRLPDMCPSIAGWRAALRVLRGAALLYDSADKSRIQMLSPIQSYVLLHHPLGQESLEELRASYYKLAPSGKTMTQHPEYKEVAKELAKEETNMEAILMNALHDRDEDREAALTASLSYTIYLHHNQTRTEVITEAIRVGRAVNSSTLPHCLLWHAAILDRERRFDEAEPLFEEARDEFMKLGDQKFAASCSGFLGALFRGRGQYDKALGALQEARDTSLQLGDFEGAAWNLLDIGQIFYKKGEYKAACSTYEQARSEFVNFGDHFGSLYCLSVIGAALGRQGDHDAAQSALEEAILGFTEYGDLYNVAYILRDLGDTLKRAKNYSLSLIKFEEALAIFTQIATE
ncbi:hypothetical protein FRC02_002905 [Tulasnella sp. 418]|nr:hypothetical protein FRC02_002905 [Tulasnella sp. 418]